MTQTASGTSRFTGGLGRTTWERPSLPVRLAGFTVAVVAVAVLIVGIDTNIWRAQARLEEGFAAIRTEKFYFGVNFRTGLRKLSDSLLDYQLMHKPADLENFRGEAQSLQAWLDAKRGTFAAPAESQAFLKLRSAYAGFLGRVGPMISTNNARALGPDGFAGAYNQLKADYRPVLEACDEVMGAEHQGFDVFLADAEHALLSLQRLFMLSLVLLAALAAALAWLVYRGMLAPLRAQLSESQALLVRQEKLASLGALGAGVAHEIRNPLTAIKFRLFSLKRCLPPPLAESEDVRTISDEINRLDRIVKDFLQFARPSEPELVGLPAERILQEVRELMQAQLEQADIELKLEIAQPAWIFADTYQLKQVLINLVQNSAESIGRTGVIKLGLTRGSTALDGSYRPVAILSIADTGRGIPAEVQKRLFDPFFTTKENGTGLGLAIAARIVEKHGGLLRYQTEVNRGTAFELVLPATPDHATKNTPDRR